MRWLVVWGVGLALAGCDKAAEGPESGAEPVKVPAPAPLEITADADAGLIFRYVDPESGKVATAAAVEDIPVGARKRVVVVHPDKPDPAGWTQVADLSAPLPVKATPLEDFSLTAIGGSAKAAGAASSSAKKAGPKEVVMFSTRYCGYCRKARSFFKQNKVAFSEYDVDTDPKAPARMAELAGKAGVPQSRLRGVPIIFIDGRPVLGWDQREVSQLLGI